MTISELNSHELRKQASKNINILMTPVTENLSPTDAY